MRILTCTAPVNIALIKYWGKRDEDLILPINDSLSITLDTNEMHAKTTVAASQEFEKDRIWLNGVEETFDNPRLSNCMKEIRRRSSCLDVKNCKIHICSENNFPTAAGLASSAAGYACLVYTLCKIFDISGDVSGLARLGSGSACRSIYGGFVRWFKGSCSDGSDSIAKCIFPVSHWSNMRALICVANDTQKKVSSSIGMKNGVETSELLFHRAQTCVPQKIEKLIQAIEKKDFLTFAQITIKDSNQFHAICQDTYPPNVYMSSLSHSIASFVHTLNARFSSPIVAYTFDAGPNACLFLLEENVSFVAGLLQHFFSSSQSSSDFFKGKSFVVKTPSESETKGYDIQSSELKYVIVTGIGEGPQVLDDSNHLLSSNGFPISSHY